MSGWCPSSSLCGVWNGGGVCRCQPVLSSGVARAPLVPVQYSPALRSCRVLSIAGRVVCVVCVVCVVFVWWGILRLPSPIRGGGWGHCGWWGGMMRWGGMIVKGGRCDACPSRLMLVSPSFSIGVPLVVGVVAVLNGGVWCVL